MWQKFVTTIHGDILLHNRTVRMGIHLTAYRCWRLLPVRMLNTYDRKTLIKLIRLLNDNDKELIGTQGYRRIIFKNQSELAKILGIDRRYLSKGVADLERHDIVRYTSGMLIVNPLVFNENSIYDIRALQAFNIKLTNDIPTKKFTDNAIMVKADESTRSKIGF